MRSDEGRRVKACVVAEPGVDGDALRSALPAWAAARLAAPERPVAWTFGPACRASPAAKWPIGSSTRRRPAVLRLGALMPAPAAAVGDRSRSRPCPPVPRVRWAPARS
ncbi:hypothetical protein [Massilia putida]|uniref:hypothetical protein n=1 Tax=Massilia putida TaxID=1141883 RepID=UPI00351D1370